MREDDLEKMFPEGVLIAYRGRKGKVWTIYLINREACDDAALHEAEDVLIGFFEGWSRAWANKEEAGE